MNQIVSRSLDFIKSQKLIANNQPVILAVSGGADSVCLAYLFAELKKHNLIQNECIVAHINHNLRGDDAKADQLYVEKTAQQLGWKFETESIDVKGYARQNGLSIETAARELRLRSLNRIAGNYRSNLIVTAHHMNDNAETMIHRLKRGTGLRGLCGIWPKKEFEQGFTIIRPLLCIRRAEIIEYLKEKAIQWQHDYTNDETVYTRNFIRHRVLPDLQAHSEADLIENLFHLSLNCQKLNAKLGQETGTYIDSITVSDTESFKTVSLNLEILASAPKLIKIEIIREMMIRVGLSEGRIEKVHIDNISSLIEKKHGSAYVELPRNLVAYRKNAKLYLASKDIRVDIRNTDTTAQAREIGINSQTQFAGWNVESRLINISECDLEKFKAGKNELIEWFDFDKIQGPIRIRQRIEGDKFVPIGMKSPKKVGKFLTTAKIDPETKRKVVVFTDNEKIFWVCPVRASQNTAVDDQTKRILEIKLCATNP